MVLALYLLLSSLEPSNAFGPPGQTVLELTNSTFDAFKKDNDRVVVMFYDPKCGHCQRFAPEYETAAQNLTDNGAETILARIDGEAYSDIADHYRVSGYPTVMHFFNGKKKRYDTGKKSPEKTASELLIEWVMSYENGAVKDLTSEEQIASFQKSNEFVIIGFFGGDKECGSKDMKEISYRSQGKMHQGHEWSNFSFGIVSDNKGIAKKFGVTSFPSMAMYKNGPAPARETFDVVWRSNWTALVGDFVARNRFPIIDEITAENHNQYRFTKVPMVWISVNNTEMAGQVEGGIFRSLVEAQLKQLPVRIPAVYLDTAKYGSYAARMGLTTSPSMMIIESPPSNRETSLKTKFKFQDVVHEENIANFFAEYLAGNLTPWRMSEAVPTNQTTAVMKTVGDTYSSIVMAEKLTMMMFYAPWCAQSKALAPAYENAATRFKLLSSLSGGEHYADVVLAKIDVTKNDVPVRVTHFPTLMWYPWSGYAPVEYTGDLSADAIIPWITEEVTYWRQRKQALEEEARAKQAQVSADQAELQASVIEVDDDFQALETESESTVVSCTEPDVSDMDELEQEVAEDKTEL